MDKEFSQASRGGFSRPRGRTLPRNDIPPKLQLDQAVRLALTVVPSCVAQLCGLGGRIGAYHWCSTTTLGFAAHVHL